MPREIGIGVLGYSIGRVHAHAWRDLAEVYYPMNLVPRLVAISGRTERLVKTEAAKFGYEKIHSDWENVVRNDKVEIVDNCLPVALHPAPMILGASLGKNLFCEKPLARRASDAKKMLDAAARAKVKHMTGYNYRFLPAVKLTQQMIEGGELGEITFFRGSYLTTNGTYDDPKTPMRWQFDPSMSGYGALGDLGTHAIDLARFLVGEVSAVAGASTTIIKERPVSEGSHKKKRVKVDDTTVATVKFRRGALGVFEASWLTPGRMDYLGFEVYGTKGSVRFNLERMNELLIYLNKKQNRGYNTINVLRRDDPFMKQFWWNQGGGFGWEHTFVNEFHHFLVSISEDSPVGPQGATFLDGYRNCLIMDAIANSARTENWVHIQQ